MNRFFDRKYPTKNLHMQKTHKNNAYIVVSYFFCI